MNIIIEWKSRDFKHNHAWVANASTENEHQLCKPDKTLPYIKPERFANIGEQCKQCLAIIKDIKKKYPKVKVHFQDYVKPVKKKIKSL